MRTLIVVVVAAACLVSSALAGALIEPLRGRGASGLCTADRAWCVTVLGDRAIVRHRSAGAVGSLALETNEDERVESALWRSIVRLPRPGQGETVLVGVARTQREAYSGGGGFVTTLTLFELRAGAGGEPRAVLTVPLESSFLIRVCFSPADQRQRRGACHDEYRYRASLSVAPRGPGDLRLVYRARASSFPGPRTRFDDSKTDGQLRKADLYWARDRNCTFSRELVRDVGAGAFVWSAPPPACPGYLEVQ